MPDLKQIRQLASAIIDVIDAIEPLPASDEYEFIPAACFKKGRSEEIRSIVIHCTAGSFAGAVSWFQNPNSKVSSHYVISPSGRVVQMVRDEDTAWHAGVKTNDNFPGNPNDYTIGIEFAALADEEWTEEQYNAGGKLIAKLRKKHPVYPMLLIPHNFINNKKLCPGYGDLQRLQSEAKNWEAKLK
jgi:N-acetyl-anhydromuramyl-L-alanine amidase AmpD